MNFFIGGKMLKRMLISILTLFAMSATSYAARNSQYIPPNSPGNPLMGNWARSYQVSNRNGDMHWQMEIYSFTPNKTVAIYYYVDGSKHPFKKMVGHYEIQSPLVLIYAHKKGEVNLRNGVWKDCTYIGNQMTCEGYHTESVPFTRWLERPDRLKEACCQQLSGWSTIGRIE